ncbi:MAG: helix-turn-helix transcriptional regulator [Gemmatimonadales bacterium]
MSKDGLGGFEQLVLLALLRLGEPAHTAPLVIEIEERSGRPVSAAKVYIALRRLEQRGLVISCKREPEPGEGGRGRRSFKATARAVALLRRNRRTLERFWEGLKPLEDEAR